MLPRMVRVKGSSEMDLNWLPAQRLLSKRIRGCPRGMMLGTAKGDFSLPGMEARCDKPQQGTTCTTLAPGLWHGHMQRAAAAGLSDFFAPPISLKTKISKKVFANQDFYLTIPYGVLYLPCRKVRPELVGAFCFLGHEESPGIQTTDRG